MLRRNGDESLGKKWRRRKATAIWFGHGVAANISTRSNGIIPNKKAREKFAGFFWWELLDSN